MEETLGSKTEGRGVVLCLAVARTVDEKGHRESVTPGVIFAPRIGKGRKNRPRLDNNLLTPAGPRFFANAT